MTQGRNLISLTCLSYLVAGIERAVPFSDIRVQLERILFRGTVLSLIPIGLVSLLRMLSLGHPEMFPGSLVHSGTGIFFEFVSIMLFGAWMLFYLFAQLNARAEFFRRWMSCTTSLIGKFGQVFRC